LLLVSPVSNSIQPPDPGSSPIPSSNSSRLADTSTPRLSSRSFTAPLIQVRSSNGRLENPAISRARHPGIVISPSPLLGRKDITSVPAPGTPETSHDERFLWFVAKSEQPKDERELSPVSHQLADDSMGSHSMVLLDESLDGSSSGTKVLGTKSSVDLVDGPHMLNMLHGKRKRTLIQVKPHRTIIGGGNVFYCLNRVRSGGAHFKRSYQQQTLTLGALLNARLKWQV
jgi:hypothetical protein